MKIEWNKRGIVICFGKYFILIGLGRFSDDSKRA